MTIAATPIPGGVINGNSVTGVVIAAAIENGFCILHTSQRKCVRNHAGQNALRARFVFFNRA
jgi:hypothetical protein